MDIAAIGTAIETLNFLRSSARALMSERDARKLAAGLQDMHERLTIQNVLMLEISQKALALVDAHEELKQRLVALEQEKSELQKSKRQLQRYHLVALPTGALVYAPRPRAKGAQPAHYACPNCYDGPQKKSILQPTQDPTHLACPACGKTFQVHSAPSYAATRRGGPMAR